MTGIADRCTCGDMCDSYDYEPCPVHEPEDTCTCEMGEMGMVEVLTPGCLIHDAPDSTEAPGERLVESFRLADLGIPDLVYEYIMMVDVGPSKSGKTNIYRVHAKKDSAFLGRIAWFGRWRQYAFYPTSSATFSAGCLIDIAHFIACLHEQRAKDAKGDRAS